MAVFHIKAANSVDVDGEDAFHPGGEGALIVDANAFLISESGGEGAALRDSWAVTINGTVEAFGAGMTGIDLNLGLNQSVTIGSTESVFSNDIGVFMYATTTSLSSGHHRLTNKGIITGGAVGIGLTAAGQDTPISINND